MNGHPSCLQKVRLQKVRAHRQSKAEAEAENHKVNGSERRVLKQAQKRMHKYHKMNGGASLWWLLSILVQGYKPQE